MLPRIVSRGIIEKNERITKYRVGKAGKCINLRPPLPDKVMEVHRF